MHRRRIRTPLIWSSIIAIAGELLLAGVAAAATGGGDFPRIRLLLTVIGPPAV